MGLGIQATCMCLCGPGSLHLMLRLAGTHSACPPSHRLTEIDAVVHGLHVLAAGPPAPAQLGSQACCCHVREYDG